MAGILKSKNMSEFNEVTRPIEKPIASMIDLRSINARNEIASQEIAVFSEQLGHGLWKNMLDNTQVDGVERGIFISTDKKGQIFTSKIYSGKGEKKTEGIVSENNRPSFDMNPISRNFTQLLNPTTMFHKDIVIVHTHPDNYPTFSGHDICAYLQTEGPAKDTNAFVMINHLGAHLLLGPHREAPDLDKIEKKYQEIKAKEITDIEKIKEMASLSKEYGITYYFQPNIEINSPYLSFKRGTDL